jgi:hypothetical protein
MRLPGSLILPLGAKCKQTSTFYWPSPRTRSAVPAPAPKHNGPSYDYPTKNNSQRAAPEKG